MINRYTGVPLYRQIEDELEQKIRSGEWKPGDQIPTEEQLQQVYGVSRITIQRALRDLSTQGLLKRNAGKGTFVSEIRPEENLFEIINFMRDAPAIEGDHHVLSGDIIVPDVYTKSLMGLGDGEQTVRLERVKLHDRTPIALEVSYVPFHLCPGLLDEDLRTLILYDHFKRNGIHLVDSKMYVQPSVLSLKEASVLEMDPGTPVFLWQRLSFVNNTSVVELSTFIIRSDMQRFFVKFRV